ncbi:MAG: substrate-binding domain-containing protein [Bacteroidales bacterium]|jgi:phosphate transport system substrate-binding protein|nr:substrate-binding domain-containing protein [Bacteroidales bacterium]
MKSVISLIICSCVLILAACDKTEPWPSPPDPNPDPIVGYPKGTPTPEPQNLDNLNQYVVKGTDWKQFVKDKTQFVLGEAESESFGMYQKWPWSTAFIRYKQSYGTFPAIDGSTVLIPMAAEFVWQFTELSDTLPYQWKSETLGFLNFSTTPGAYNKIINGGTTSGVVSKQISMNTLIEEYHFNKRPDIVLATYPSTAELNMASRAGIELIIKPVCYDSFVFITHKDNPVESLTVEQIQKIYSGKITNWKEVGGNNSEIIAYQREPKSGSQTAMEEMVMKGVSMIKPPTERVPVGMGMLIDEVSYYKNNTMSLGYTYKYYIDRLYENPDIKILKVDGIMPSDENVRNNSYAFVTPYNAVIRSTDIDEVGGRFLNWILSDEGQASVSQAGYVSINSL